MPERQLEICANIIKTLLGKFPLLDRSVELHKPECDLLLVLLTLVRVVDLKKDTLDESSHVGEDADTDDLNDHLVQILKHGLACHVTVTNGCETGHDPIDGCNI